MLVIAMNESTHHITSFLETWLAPNQFTSSFLQRSFNQTEGWVELFLTIVLLISGFYFSALWIKKKWSATKHSRSRLVFIPYIIQRLVFPIITFILASCAVYLWTWFGLQAVWLRLLVLAMHWLAIIRLVLAIIHTALPTSSLTDQLERVSAFVLWLVFLTRLSGVEDLIFNWLKSFQFAIGSVKLNLWIIITGVIWVAMMIILAMWLAKLARNKLMESKTLNINVRIMLSNIIQIVLVILSILIALPLIGIDLTVLSVLGGALGVGIGFGLQKIASNYISGFIILGDGSIRIGNRLTVNDFTGYVTKITSRFVVLRSLQGAEALIPNETFITQTVINDSYSSNSLLQHIDLQISYQSNVELAMQIMIDVAKQYDRIDTSSGPNAYLLSFADNGVNLRLSFWLKDPENGYLALFSKILLEIWQGFKEHQIEFPYPQREIRILNQETSIQTVDIPSARKQEATHDHTH